MHPNFNKLIIMATAMIQIPFQEEIIQQFVGERYSEKDMVGKNWCV